VVTVGALGCSVVTVGVILLLTLSPTLTLTHIKPHLL
jgi:hypothetical protein